MARYDGNDGYIYEVFDEDGLSLYDGKHEGPHPASRLRDHSRNDAEFMRHMDYATVHRTSREGILDTERQRIEKANDGEGTVFNNVHNAGGWRERYYDGYSSRWSTDEEPDPEHREARRDRAAGHPGYEGRQAQRRRETHDD